MTLGIIVYSIALIWTVKKVFINGLMAFAGYEDSWDNNVILILAMFILLLLFASYIASVMIVGEVTSNYEWFSSLSVDIRSFIIFILTLITPHLLSGFTGKLVVNCSSKLGLIKYTGGKQEISLA
ncbi:hypothetical protein HNP92_001815 [Methanococcus maripaludis]|uniref:Uncharacterized protein n=1 Tax=Methanococcus maripaludis TaxID=39152 RepID=A0A7J9S9B7_METMI|nr:hypothetical protein [Methanococcus maripaludis]MBB6402493.1 hypothetical protein [Methanococcus maripaludis]